MAIARIEDLARQCEDAAVARIEDYFGERSSRPGADRTALAQADLFLRLASGLHRIAQRESGQ